MLFDTGLGAVKGEVAPDALCRELPAGFDPAAYRTRPYTPTQFMKDGHIIDLGERRLTVLHVPGHTPDAVALLDAAAGVLFTGDTFYESTIWLFVPETELAAYAASVDRLAAMVENGQVTFTFEGFRILTSRAALAGL